MIFGGRRLLGAGFRYVGPLPGDLPCIWSKPTYGYERVVKRLFCYSMKRLRKMYGDGPEFDIAMELGHGYIADLPRRWQRIELGHIKHKMSLLIESGLLLEAIDAEWYILFLRGCLTDHSKHADATAAAKWALEGKIHIPDFSEKAFEEFSHQDREAWWDDALRKLSRNAANIWNGGVSNGDLAILPLYDRKEMGDDERRMMREHDIKRKFALVGRDEREVRKAMCSESLRVMQNDMRHFEDWLAKIRENIRIMNDRNTDIKGFKR